ncbi:MAG: assimilatory sulfite reductase (NADPH) flavoprotein subunit [Pseudomonadota bacterium]
MFASDLPPGMNPLTPEQSQLMQQLLTTLTPIQQAWISGYLAASANGAAGTLPATQVAAAPATAAVPLTVLFGSQTGNAKHVAQDLADNAKARGLDVNLVDMADYKPKNLKDEKYLAIVVSTQGEGDPPETAERFYEFIASKKAPKLDGTKIAVLGLGDSSYEFFCQAAVDVEERLVKLGATPVFDKALFDVDYDDHAPAWIEGAVDIFEPDLKADNEGAANNVVPMPGLVPGLAAVAPPVSQYSKKNPFAAEVSVVQKITGRDSTKDVRHVEISLDGSDLTYRPGDSLGVYFRNDEAEIEAVLEKLKLDGDTEVSIGEKKKPLREALATDLELTQSYPSFVEKYVAATTNKALAKIAEDKTTLRAYIEDRQIYDILHEHPRKIDAQSLVECLRKIQPRLYSIASSQEEVEDEVHTTVGVVDYEAFDRRHLGGASGYLGRRIQDGDKVDIYIEQNDNFRLPSSPDTPVIMVGPGTGIAPFRAFLQERDGIDAEGKNWLFFGNPHFTQDFLYQVELQDYLKSGLLTKLDVAFSRDQEHKIYVQDRLKEKGEEIFAWLEEGAHFYVCGDGDRMAKDVHAALIDIVKTHGGKDLEAAEDYISALKDAKRYQRDVY